MQGVLPRLFIVPINKVLLLHMDLEGDGSEPDVEHDLHEHEHLRDVRAFENCKKVCNAPNYIEAVSYRT